MSTLFYSTLIVLQYLYSPLYSYSTTVPLQFYSTPTVPQYPFSTPIVLQYPYSPSVPPIPPTVLLSPTYKGMIMMITKTQRRVMNKSHCNLSMARKLIRIVETLLIATELSLTYAEANKEWTERIIVQA